MKKLILIVLVLFCILLLIPNKEKSERKVEVVKEKKAVFFSYIELQKYVKNTDVSDSKKGVDKIVNTLDEYKFNMLILQVRSFSDAIYESKLFPWSSSVSSSEGITPGYDVLAYFIKRCHEKNIEVHAWVNPYRIRNNNDTSTISEKNKAYSLLNTNSVQVSEGGIFYNPASEEVKKLIVDGISEIVSNYSVDGILFDDYFYPNSTIDLENFREYSKNNDISLEEYHLMQVNDLVKRVHIVTKKHNVLFGISPEGNISNNYSKNFADVKKWGEEDGYVDYLMPQIYYGFNNEVQPFYQVLAEWNDLIKNNKILLMPALAFYKVNQQDKYAKGGINEWCDEDDIIMRQVILSRNATRYGGFAIFRYDSIFSDDLSLPVLKEKENLKKVIVS